MRSDTRRRAWQWGVALVAIAALAAPNLARACPFCSAVSLTLSEEINSNQLAVLARLIELPEAADPVDPAKSMATFELVDVLKGQEHLKNVKQFKALYFGQDETGTMFYLVGNDAPQVNWSTPVALSPRALDYIRKLADLPESGPDRLAFFQEHFEDPEELLMRDAYDEFAKAPYADVQVLKDRMHHDRLVRWIQDPNVSASHRRLYLTMLGVCGTEDDVPMLEGMIQAEDRETKAALDAMIACYLILKGPDGMPLVEDLFLKNKSAEYTDTYAAIMALRFHGQETDVIPRQRLIEAMRHMLDRPELADLVIPDLARWQDWGAMDRLVELFKNADDESSWVRVPVVNFLRACPDPQAQVYLEELAEIDPDAIKRASSFFPFAAQAPPAAQVTRDGGEPTAAAADTETAAPQPAEGEAAAVGDGEAEMPADAAAVVAALEPPSDQPPQPQPPAVADAQAVAVGPRAAANPQPAAPRATPSERSPAAASPFFLGIGAILAVAAVVVVLGVVTLAVRGARRRETKPVA